MWNRKEPPTLGIVVPCYNEEEVLAETAKQLGQVLDQLKQKEAISSESYILFVDDGSLDRTWEKVAKLHHAYRFIRGLKLAKNAGHQNALLAGLMQAKEDADCVVSIDADLQDDVEAIHAFVEKFRQGVDIVYGVRDDRSSDSWFKRMSAQSFYRWMSRFGVDIIYNHADYRLMSRRALEGLAQFEEVNLFLRGIVPLIGYRADKVYYARRERFAGESKYPLRKMLGFAIDGVTSFSVRPIRIVTVIGMVCFALSIVVGLYALFAKIFGYTDPGWTSIFISVWFIGGLQIMCTGLVGEYIGKIYREVKRRPKYIVEQLLAPDAELAPLPSEHV